MGYPASAIANQFLDIAKRRKEGLSPLKIQKLVFLSHAWHLALTGKPLVDDEFPEAWPYGPVFPSIYHQFKHFGRDAITERASEMAVEGTTVRSWHPEIKAHDVKVIKLLDRIWKVYGHLSGTQLSRLTHAPGTPWDETRQAVGKIRNAPIHNDLIKRYYQGKMEP